jgi:hypothetical protein
MAKVKVGDFFEHTERQGAGWSSKHYRVAKIVPGTFFYPAVIEASPFKWGDTKGQIVITGPKRDFEAGPNGSLPANCVKVRVK